MPEEILNMKTTLFRIACPAFAILLLAGCASPLAGTRTPRSVALIMSGDVVGYSSPGFATRVSVADVDGKPVKEPYGPVELAPGRHTVTLACDSVNTPHALTVAAGEVYQFVARSSSGAKGCVGTLARVRTANP
jgi:hypothetical protein